MTVANAVMVANAMMVADAVTVANALTVPNCISNHVPMLSCSNALPQCCCLRASCQ